MKQKNVLVERGYIKNFIDEVCIKIKENITKGKLTIQTVKL